MEERDERSIGHTCGELKHSARQEWTIKAWGRVFKEKHNMKKFARIQKSKLWCQRRYKVMQIFGTWIWHVFLSSAMSQKENYCQCIQRKKEEKEEDYIPGLFKVWTQYNQNHLGKKKGRLVLLFLCTTLDIERMITTLISKTSGVGIFELREG